MPWVRHSDNAHSHPIVMRSMARGELEVGTLSPVGRANLVRGFADRCYEWSAEHLTDHFVSAGAIYTLGGPEGELLAREAKAAGYFTTRATRDGERGWLMVADENFIHIRLKEEVEWERQQRNDTRNPDITMPVRLRDGDGCRYCGCIVQWSNRRGARGATYDHREPGKPATVETLVIACRSCNSGRKNDADADNRYPLRAVPLEPYYCDGTRAQLVKYGLLPRSGSQPATATLITSRSGSQPATAQRDPGQSAATPRTGSAETQVDGSGSAGSGRVGPGSGPGSGAPSAPRRRRRTRGRRGNQR